MNPVPKTVLDWIIEIRAAFVDAAETIPFGPLAGVELKVSDLFQLAPVIMLKFRSLPRTRKNLKTATEAALSSYVASTSRTPALLDYPVVCFALCYVAAHYGFDLVSRRRADQITDEIHADPNLLVLTDAEFERAWKKSHSKQPRSLRKGRGTSR